MKVLKRGKVDTRWAGECKHCGTIGICDVAEVKIVPEKNGIQTQHGTAECPECGVKDGVKVYHVQTQYVRQLFKKNDINFLRIVVKNE